MESINMRADEIAAAVKQAEALPIRSDNALEILNKAQPRPKKVNSKKRKSLNLQHERKQQKTTVHACEKYRMKQKT